MRTYTFWIRVPCPILHFANLFLCVTWWFVVFMVRFPECTLLILMKACQSHFSFILVTFGSCLRTFCLTEICEDSPLHSPLETRWVWLLSLGICSQLELIFVSWTEFEVKYDAVSLDVCGFQHQYLAGTPSRRLSGLAPECFLSSSGIRWHSTLFPQARGWFHAYLRYWKQLFLLTRRLLFFLSTYPKTQLHSP